MSEVKELDTVFVEADDVIVGAVSCLTDVALELGGGRVVVVAAAVVDDDV